MHSLFNLYNRIAQKLSKLEKLKFAISQVLWVENVAEDFREAVSRVVVACKCLT